MIIGLQILIVQRIGITNPNDQARPFVHLIKIVYPDGRGRGEDYRYSSAIDWAGGKGLLDVTLV